MRARRLVRWGGVLALFFLVTVLSSCLFWTGDGGPIELTVSSPNVTIAWDPASISQVGGTPSSVDRYELFYRRYGSHEWLELGASSGTDAWYTISASDIEYGRYEFAVRSVLNDGRTSELHLSSDFDAHPTGGWYINWTP